MSHSNTPTNNDFDDLDAEFEAEFEAEEGADKKAKNDSKESEKAKQEGTALGTIYVLLEKISAAEARGEYKEALKLCRGGIQRILIPHRKFRGGALGLASKFDFSATKAQLEQKARDLSDKIKAKNNNDKNDECNGLIKLAEEAEVKAEFVEALVFYKQAYKIAKKHKLPQLTALKLKIITHKSAKKDAKRAVKDAAREDKLNAQLDELTLNFSPIDDDISSGELGDLIEIANNDATDTTPIPSGTTTSTINAETAERVDTASYLMTMVKKAAAENKDNLFENFSSLTSLLALVKSYHDSGRDGLNGSVLESLGADPKHATDMLKAILGSVRGSAIGDRELAQWLEPEPVRIRPLLCERVFIVGKQAPPEKIDEAIKKFNVTMDQFTGWKAYFSPIVSKAAEFSYAGHAKSKRLEIKKLREVVKDPEEFKKAHAEILASIKPLPSAIPFDKDTVDRLNKSLEISKTDKLKGQINILLTRGDIQDSRDALQEIEDAFECSPEKYTTHYADTFEGKTPNEVRRELNSAFPTLNLGSLVLKLNNPDQSDDLIIAIADRLHITDINELAKEVNSIAAQLITMWPKIDKSASIGSHFGA